MKRRILHLSAAFLTCAIGLLAYYGISSRNSSGFTVDLDCASEPVATSDYSQSFKPTLNLDNTAEMGATLDGTLSLTSPSIWNADIILTNTGDKVITGYEIEFIESYEFKKEVWSADGTNGIRLEPGQAKTISLIGVGFCPGYSYGKPVGRLQENTFRIRHLDFEDGSVIDNKNRKLLPQD